jgi:hypothetical protein
MSHPEKQVVEGRVPVSTSGPHCPKGLQERVLALQERSVQMQITHKTDLPDTRSPLDPWHTEGYLIRCLVHLHGWAHLEAGVLRRMKRG